MRKKQFIVIRGMKGYIIPYLLKDLDRMENAIVRRGNIAFSSKLQYYLYRIHNSKRINEIIDLPFKTIWLKEKYSYLENYRYEDDTDYYIIVLNLAVNTLCFPRLKSIKKDNVKLVLAFFDPIDNEFSSKIAFKYRHYFDLVMTFDDDDAKKYGFEHFFQRYSKFVLNSVNTNKGLYFVGHSKGRSVLLEKIAEKLETNKIPYVFKIVGGKQEKASSCKSINYLKKAISYTDVLDDISKSDCLLEIVQDGQSGATARYAEAVCYNKKLLTNNKKIVNFPYYDSRFMKIFSKMDDIDLEWLNSKDKVEYFYKGDFSPVVLLNEISIYFSNFEENKT